MDLQTIPDRETLLEQLRRANQFTWLWVTLQIIAVIVLVFLIRWNQVLQSPIVSIGAGIFIVGPFFSELFYLWGQKKKRLEDIKDSSRFGEIDKYDLQRLFEDTRKRLQLPIEKLPVYVVNEKLVNAAALPLGRFFGWVNGIYLYRQLLHQVSAHELQSVIGHELGHYYRFYVSGSRFRLLTLILGVLVGVFAVQQIQLGGMLGFIVMSMISSAFWMISGISTGRHGYAIEHLCDDLGAQVQGIEASINSLMKINLNMETQYLIQLEVMALNADHKLLTPQDIAAAIQKATPYGRDAEPELLEKIQRELKQKSLSKQQFSISGFINYMRELDEDDEDFKDELAAQAKMVNKIDRIDWESILDDRQSVRFSLPQIELLVQMILNSPEKSLFRIPQGGQFEDGIHPSIKKRILYLWKNRNSRSPLIV
jgi:Zn-dependent protease with chaperone function